MREIVTFGGRGLSKEEVYAEIMTLDSECQTELYVRLSGMERDMRAGVLPGLAPGEPMARLDDRYDACCLDLGRGGRAMVALDSTPLMRMVVLGASAAGECAKGELVRRVNAVFALANPSIDDYPAA